MTTLVVLAAPKAGPATQATEVTVGATGFGGHGANWGAFTTNHTHSSHQLTWGQTPTVIFTQGKEGPPSSELPTAMEFPEPASFLPATLKEQV